ncbi:HNH endonuclease signature motif containing protein [Microbacterium sp. NPDC089695]|uniref:HNH endonuclease signature motif containing protein n=1 Tax=Microbacterium sp. NPDC089695 TaxID=3364198 RepID=UPI00380F148C
MATPDDSDLDRRRALLDAWLEKRRAIAVLEAEAAALLDARMQLSQSDAAEHPFHRDAIHRSMIAEYAAAGRQSTGSMEYAFTDAAFLHRSHPEALAAFRTGSITAQHVRAIVREGDIVREAVRNGRADSEALHAYDTGAVVVAENESPARTAVHVRALAAALAGTTVVERLERSRAERTVEMRSVGDGLALLTVVLPEHLAVAIMDRLTQLARGVVAARKIRRSDTEQFHARHESLDGGSDRDDVGAGTSGRIENADHGESAEHGAGAGRGESHDAAAFGDDRGAIFGDGTFTTDPLVTSTGSIGTGHPGDRTSGDADGGSTGHPDGKASTDADGENTRHRASDDRTIDQVRADLLTDMLLAADPSAANGSGLDGVQARIQVTVAATTLARLDDRPAELDGVGPLHPEIARDLAGRNGGWSRLFLDARGIVTATDTYSPTEPMRRFLRARDQHCRFPGCRMPVHRCQIDHTHDHAKGGRTENHNLAHLCASHHVLKHPDIADDHRWSARQLSDGSIDWLSPLGRSYRDSPQRRVMFT